ncbi:MAG: phosphoribosylglycinamide synthetase C domain-containing protein, partial [Actinomycetota bacterium]
AGLALTSKGLRVVEFNARFGDPETQVVLARLDSPLVDLLLGSATGTLADAAAPRWSEGAAVTVVIASEGYPEKPVTGDPIEGLAEANAVPHAYVLHAGTKPGDTGPVSSGGRVLSVVGTGPTLTDARAAAYAVVERISLRGSHHRGDIALSAAAAESGRIGG